MTWTRFSECPLPAVTEPEQDGELNDPAPARYSQGQHTREDSLYPRMLRP